MKRKNVANWNGHRGNDKVTPSGPRSQTHPIPSHRPIQRPTPGPTDRRDTTSPQGNSIYGELDKDKIYLLIFRYWLYHNSLHNIILFATQNKRRSKLKRSSVGRKYQRTVPTLMCSWHFTSDFCWHIKHVTYLECFQHRYLPDFEIMLNLMIMTWWRVRKR